MTRPPAPAFLASLRRLAPLLVLLTVAAVPSAVLTLWLAPAVHEANPLPAGTLA